MIDSRAASRGAFVTPGHLAQGQAQEIESARGRLLIAGCCSGAYLSSRVISRYRELLGKAGSGEDPLCLENIDYRFSDSETCVRLDLHAGGADVFLVQALFDPTSTRSVDQNYVAFLIAARTFREHGASHVTAVLPYLA